jgi:tetratricopeptide (TPR) repeat protein
MRGSMECVALLLIACASRDLCAQESRINGLNLQIPVQKAVVQSAPGRKDGQAWLKLAVLCQDAAQYRDSERAYHRAVALLKPGDRSMFAEALDHMGTMYMETNRLLKAESAERRALAIREDEKDLRGIGVSHMHLAAVLLRKSEIVSAESEAQMAVSLLAPQQAHPAVQTAATPEEKMTALIDLSLVRCAQQACADAVPVLKRALAIAHDHYLAESVPVGMLDFLLGYALWKSGDLVGADQSMQRGTRELATRLGWGHPTYIRALGQYETFLMQVGRTNEAEQVSTQIATLTRSPIREQQATGFAMGLDQVH